MVSYHSIDRSLHQECARLRASAQTSSAGRRVGAGAHEPLIFGEIGLAAHLSCTFKHKYVYTYQLARQKLRQPPTDPRFRCMSERQTVAPARDTNCTVGTRTTEATSINKQLREYDCSCEHAYRVAT